MRILQLALASLALLSTACSGDSWTVSAKTENGGRTGTSQALAPGGGLVGVATAAGPQAGLTPPYLRDPNQGGAAASLHLVDLAWGRLVDVFDVAPVTGARRLVLRDLVVGPSIASDGVDYALAKNLAQQEELTILHPRGSAAFDAALAAAEAARVPIADKGLPPLSLPPWTPVPRNAALSLRFDDLLDPATVDGVTVQLFVGDPPLAPFDARVLVDRAHGDLADPDGDGVFEFYATRVVVDLTVSELDGQAFGPPFAVNGAGLPAALTTGAPNAALRLPTQPAPLIGVPHVLANPAGNALDFAGNGTNDPASATRDLLRAFRSGGQTQVTGDPFNGFLPDLAPPRLVGELEVTLAGGIVPDPALPRVFDVPQATFVVAGCASQPEVGDLLRQGGFWGVVQEPGVLVGQDVLDLRVRRVSAAGTQPGAGPARLHSALDPLGDDQDCFVAFQPLPGTAPNLDVDPAAVVAVRFDEAIDAGTLSAFDGFTLGLRPSVLSPRERVAGAVTVDPAGTGAVFQPSAPLPHQQGSSETYHVRVGVAAGLPVRDLAGNALAAPLDAASFDLDPTAPTLTGGSLVLRFDSVDELGGDGLPEVRGQFLYDLTNQRLAQRPVQRFDAEVSRANPLPGVMTPLSSGVQTPLNPLGAKLQQVWRYADLGFGLMDESFTNVDVEGLSWAPLGGQVVTDVYPEFQIALSHASRLPDEAPNPQTLFPSWPDSGLLATYANNFLLQDSGEVVHPRPLGYVVSPADLYLAQSGQPLLPYPLNANVPAGQGARYLWRDTALSALGGASGNGAPLDLEVQLLGLPPTKRYAAGAVPTLGLPLLMEFRCYPSASGLGLNAFDVSLAINSSARPSFRAFSAGGVDSNGQLVFVDPDGELAASGGFNPNGNPPGQSTPGVDNVVYMGALELVTATSRVHTIWLDTRAASPDYAQPALQALAPAGTSVGLAFRGATAISGGAPGQPGDVRSDAQALDPYGDPDPTASGAPQFLNGDPGWKSNIDLLDGARYLQVRVDLRGNPASQAGAALEGLGLSWSN